MMSNFAKFRGISVNHWIDRLKERKQNVTDALGSTLDAVFSTVRTACWALTLLIVQ